MTSSGWFRAEMMMMTRYEERYIIHSALKRKDHLSRRLCLVEYGALLNLVEKSACTMQYFTRRQAKFMMLPYYIRWTWLVRSIIKNKNIITIAEKIDTKIIYTIKASIPTSDLHSFFIFFNNKRSKSLAHFTLIWSDSFLSETTVITSLSYAWDVGKVLDGLSDCTFY